MALNRVDSLDNMQGGVAGIVNDINVLSGKAYVAEKFNSAGGSSNFQHFAIWNNDSNAWDSHVARLLGYEGFNYATLIDVDPITGILTVNVNANGTGAVEDSVFGIRAVPWSTTLIDWNTAGFYWQNWR